MVEYIENSLRWARVEPERLGFEMTEAAMVEDTPATRVWIARLKGLGCRLALDDFGSGFSSFVHLRAFPVDQLKLDGSLVRSIATEPTQRAIVQAMQTLATTMGKEVVGEFVEDEAIAQVLIELGVVYGQGYHLGRPEPFPDSS